MTKLEEILDLEIPGSKEYSVSRRHFLKNTALVAGMTAMAENAPLFSSSNLNAQDVRSEKNYDVLVYGATAGGVIAAIAAAQQGEKVILITPGRHVGGMVSGGLSATDINRQEHLVGGLAHKFFVKVAKHYNRTWSPTHSKQSDWYCEPHVAEDIFNAWLREAEVPVLFEHTLEEVRKNGTRIIGVTFQNGQTFRAQVYIDATYEGDVMARSGVDYVVGREGKADFGESLAGRQDILPISEAQVQVLVPAYDDQEHLLPLMTPGDPGVTGQGDHKVQAYSFRVCVTNNPENQVPFAPPPHYDPHRYMLASLIWQGMEKQGRTVHLPMTRITDDKFDVNTPWGGVGTTFIGENWDYPDADSTKRKQIWDAHLSYTKGFFYFAANDPSVPQTLRNALSKFGLAKDEFSDTDHWPHQLYVREARRMRGEYLMKQPDVQEGRTKHDSIGMGGYNMDMMHVQRIPVLMSHYATKSKYVAMNEGYISVPVQPYEIPYRCLLPRQNQCTNLIVPVCVSATKVAYGSLRMEAQYMIMGHAAGTAASMAVKRNLAVQQIPLDALQNKLRSEDQILSTSFREPAFSLKRL